MCRFQGFFPITPANLANQGFLVSLPVIGKTGLYNIKFSQDLMGSKHAIVDCHTESHV